MKIYSKIHFIIKQNNIIKLTTNLKRIIKNIFFKKNYTEH